MNLLRQLLFSTLLSICVVSLSNGQEMKLIDTIEQPNCEYLLARLDFFSLDVLYNSTHSIGQIILRPGLDPIENAKHEQYVRTCVMRRKIQDRLFVYTADLNDKLRIELWSGPVGSERNMKAQALTRRLPTVTKPILFDSDLFEMFYDKRKRKFVGTSCSACCISNLDWKLLSEFLAADPNLKLYIVIRGRKSRHGAIKSYLDRDMRESDFKNRNVKYLFASKNLVN